LLGVQAFSCAASAIYAKAALYSRKRAMKIKPQVQHADRLKEAAKRRQRRVNAVYALMLNVTASRLKLL
jgi:hypothetical protein